MKSLENSRKADLIRQAHKHLDIVEREIKHIFDSIKKQKESDNRTAA